MSLLTAAADIITNTADTLTGTTSTTSTTPTPTTTTPTPTTTTPTPTTTTPTPTTRTPTPTTKTPTPTTTASASTTAAPVATTAAPASSASSADATETSSPATDTSTSTTSVAAVATATSAPASGSISSSTGATEAPASATANASASATVTVNVNSQNGDDDSSSGLTVVEGSDGGMGTGAVIGIVVGAVVVVLLIVGLAFWLYRRRRQKLAPRSPSFDASYAVAPVTLPAVQAVALESFSPREPSFHDGNNFNRTVNLESTANLDSTLRLESSAASILTKKSSKSSSSLWEDSAITAARIPLEKLVIKELISEGGHGAVYHGLYRGECVAIKVLLPEKRKDMRQINIFLAEIKMMATVEHPRVVRFIGASWDALSDLCAVSEFMEGGDLFSLLRRFDRVEHRARGFDVDKAKIALHVAQALTYLHSLDPVVLHRDLKSMNILLTADWDAKLTDFGVSRKLTTETMTAGVGTRRWMAPEVMMGKHYDTSADIFSFGVVLSELDSHLPPYASAINSMTSESGEKVTETALMEMVAMGRVHVEFSANAPAALTSLGLSCVDLNPKNRPSAGEVHYQLHKILRSYQQYTL